MRTLCRLHLGEFFKHSERKKKLIKTCLLFKNEGKKHTKLHSYGVGRV